MTSALYGNIPLEPTTFLWATSGLALVSVGAAYVPARRVLQPTPSGFSAPSDYRLSAVDDVRPEARF